MFKLINILSVLIWLSASGSLSALELELYADSDVVGEPQIILAKYEDTFIKLARRYNLGYEELVQANPSVDPWLPGAVSYTHLTLPTNREE